MELICKVTIASPQGCPNKKPSWGSIIVGSTDKKSNPSEKPVLIVRTSSNNTSGTKYNLIGNIENLFTKFLNEGRATVSLKEPSCNIFISNADSARLKTFISYLKKLLTPDASPHKLPSIGDVSKLAFKPPVRQINVYGHEEYMKKIIETNDNWDHVLSLKICNCTLKLAPRTVRKMKNLRTLWLGSNDLRSSTFIEIESKELNELHLCVCQTRLEIPSLFKDNLCYKDSLVELRLEGNQWPEVPKGIFQFENLLQLSLRNNCISELPDKFNNFSKLKILLLSNNQLKYLPSSILSLHLDKLDIAFNQFNFDISVSSGPRQMIVHSLKEFAYRAVLKHNLIVEEGMLPVEMMKNLANYRQCLCGCKFVDEGQDLLFLFKISDISSGITYNYIPNNSKFPIRGHLCNSMKLYSACRFLT